MRILINWLAALTLVKWMRNRNLFLSWTMQSAAIYIKKRNTLIKGPIYNDATHLGPLFKHALILITAWIRYYIYQKVCDGMNYSLPNFTGCIVEI